MPNLNPSLSLTLSVGLLAPFLVTGCHDDSPPIGPNSVVATANPAGEISVAAGECQTIRVTFNTTDGNPASELTVEGLDALPEGWSSEASEFGCSELATGTICQLTLSYEPEGADSGALSLEFDYRDNKGTAKTGTVSIPYSATSDNNVVAATAPSGEFAVPLDQNGSITVTFATDDGASASELAITTDLATLPAGWSSTASSLECDTVDSTCQLSLTYAPTSSASGTLSLDFSYKNDSGTEKTGSIDIPYITVGAKLYAGQFGALNYCAIRGDGTLTDCKPTGDLNIPSATGVAANGNFAYIADNTQHDVAICHVGTDGSLSNCAYTGLNYFYGPFVLAAKGKDFYVTSSIGFNYIKHCTIENDGSLTGCAEVSFFELVEGITIDNGHVYMTLPHYDALWVCNIENDGSLPNCVQTGTGFDGPESVTTADGRMYVSNTESASVSTCDINGATGALSNCFTSPVDYGPMGIAIHEGHAYVSTRNGLIYVCAVGGTGALTNCAVSNGGATFGLMVQLGVQ